VVNLKNKTLYRVFSLTIALLVVVVAGFYFHSKELKQEMASLELNYERELSWANEPGQYNIEVYQVGGIGIRESQSSASYVTEHGYLKPSDKYSQISFNSPADLMWVDCMGGYLIRSCDSQDTTVRFEPYSSSLPGCGVNIRDIPKTKVRLRCVKSSQEAPERYDLLDTNQNESE
jgi:hypothetical protein